MSRAQRTFTTLFLCAALAATYFTLQTWTDERDAMDMDRVGDARIVATDGYRISCAVYHEAVPETAALEQTTATTAQPHFFAVGTAGFLYRNVTGDDIRNATDLYRDDPLIIPLRLGCAFPDETVIGKPGTISE